MQQNLVYLPSPSTAEQPHHSPVLRQKKAPKDFQAHEADAKLRRLEPIVDRALIGPRLRARFPHLVRTSEDVFQDTQGQSSAPSCNLHTSTADASLSCIAGVDTVDNHNAHCHVSQSANSHSNSSGSSQLGPNIREDHNINTAAALAGAVSPLATVDVAAVAPATAVTGKRRSKPFSDTEMDLIPLFPSFLIYGWTGHRVYISFTPCQQHGNHIKSHKSHTKSYKNHTKPIENHIKSFKNQIKS